MLLITSMFPLLQLFAKSGWIFGLIIIAIIIAAIESNKKRNNPPYNQSNSDINEPKRRKFEKEVASMFEQNWWEVVLWPWYDDGWKDIVIRKWLAIYLVQCKHYYWNWFVWPSQIRDFQWAIDLYERKNNMTVRGIFITSWKTTSKARETARMLWIELWDKYNWRDNINNL